MVELLFFKEELTVSLVYFVYFAWSSYKVFSLMKN